MASRRGMSDQERFALDLASVSATGAVVSAPCYVYSLHASLTDSTTTGVLSVGDTTAAADLLTDAICLRFKLGTAGASGNTGDRIKEVFNPPLYISKSLFFAAATGIASVSVSYKAA